MYFAGCCRPMQPGEIRDLEGPMYLICTSALPARQLSCSSPPTAEGSRGGALALPSPLRPYQRFIADLATG